MLVTTSRKPCARTRVLAKDLARLVPESETLNRGKQSVDSLVEAAREAGYGRIAVIAERHGNPSAMRFISVDEAGWGWLPKQLIFKSVKLSREFDAHARRVDTLAIEDSIGIGDVMGIESDEDGDTLLRASAEALTFFQADKEVGPRILLRQVLDEAEIED